MNTNRPEMKVEYGNIVEGNFLLLTASAHLNTVPTL